MRTRVTSILQELTHEDPGIWAAALHLGQGLLAERARAKPVPPRWVRFRRRGTEGLSRPAETKLPKPLVRPGRENAKVAGMVLRSRFAPQTLGLLAGLVLFGSACSNSETRPARPEARTPPPVANLQDTATSDPSASMTGRTESGCTPRTCRDADDCRSGSDTSSGQDDCGLSYCRAEFRTSQGPPDPEDFHCSRDCVATEDVAGWCTPGSCCDPRATCDPASGYCQLPDDSDPEATLGPDTTPTSTASFQPSTD
jgi:hypothetical protein